MKRVVITAHGTISPTGIGSRSFLEATFGGKCCISNITLFDTTGLDCKVAGEVPHFQPDAHIPEQFKPKRFSRQTQFAITAVLEALRDIPRTEWPQPLDVYVGGAVLDVNGMADSVIRVERRGPRSANPFAVPMAIQQSVAAGINTVLEWPITPVTYSTACAAGADALGEAFRAIASGKSDFIVVVGSDAPLDLYTISSATRAGLTPTKFNDCPQKSSRPFDKDRESGVISEGAACCILEEWERAVLNQRPILAEIMGYYRNMDAAGKESCNALGDAMRGALEDARVHRQDIDYISAWGPGHPTLDRAEVFQIKEVFDGKAARIPVSSIKGCIGNPFGAAGMLQVVAAQETLQTQRIPPTINHENPDPDFDLFFARNILSLPVKRMLLNTHGVGGGNSCLVLQQPVS